MLDLLTPELSQVVEETQLVFRGGGGGGSEKRRHQPQTADSEAQTPHKIFHEGSLDRVALIDEETFVTGTSMTYQYQCGTVCY